MKKYIRYVAVGAVMAISGFITDANAVFGFNVKNHLMNAVSPCNAGAMGSPKGASLVEKCLPDAETAAKNPAGAAAYWSAYCQGEGATTNADTCGIAAGASGLPEGFVCDTAAATANPLDDNTKKYCFNALGLKANEEFAWQFWHKNPSADCKNKKSKSKTQCSAITKVYAKIDSAAEPNPAPVEAAEPAPTDPNATDDPNAAPADPNAGQ